MICVLGYPLSRAMSLLEADGLTIQLQEVSCKKGSQGDSDRVVRQQALENGRVLLTWARFQTEAITI